jgi:Bcr/CflA subfamily drug resistance transporter
MNSLLYLIFISILFSSLGQVASDLYLPSLPAIAVGLHTTNTLVQATVFIYMVGFSVSRLVYGPISDAVGRKMPLVIGLSSCLIGTVICASAHSIGILISGRFLQGAGGGAGVVLGGAIIRDMAEGRDLAKLYSYLGVSVVIFIASAPLLGGYLQHWFGWRANFMFIILYAGIALLVSIFFLAETNKHKTLENLKPKKIKNNVIALFTNKSFISCAACIFLVYAALLAWLTLGPILLQDTVGITPIAFGWIALTGGVFYGSGAFINSKLLNKYTINQLLKIGAYTILAGGILMLLFFLLGLLNIWVIVIPLVIFLFGASMIFPNAYAGALIPFSKIAGIAGAILGFVQILGGSLASGIISIAPDNTQLPLAIAFITCAAVIWIMIRFVLPKQQGLE